MAIELSRHEQKQIAEILTRRSNEIAGFASDYRSKGDHYGSVELALSREIDRLRKLASRVCPPEPDAEDAD